MKNLSQLVFYVIAMVTVLSSINENVISINNKKNATTEIGGQDSPTPAKPPRP